MIGDAETLQHAGGDKTSHPSPDDDHIGDRLSVDGPRRRRIWPAIPAMKILTQALLESSEIVEVRGNDRSSQAFLPKWLPVRRHCRPAHPCRWP